MYHKLPFRAVAAMLVFCIVTVAILTVGAMKSVFGIDFRLAVKVGEIQKLAQAQYYYAIDGQSVADGVAAGYVSGLNDDYAAYYDKESAQTQIESLKGNAYGIGISVVNMPSDSGIFVWRVYEGGTAENAGIKNGDIITAVGGESVADTGYSESVEKIQGAKGEKIQLTLRRGTKTMKITVKCDECDVQTVFSKTVENGKIGVVEVTSFNAKTDVQFKKAVDLLQKDGVKAIIIDLRHNGGGTVTTAANMLDFLLPEGDTVRVRYRSGKTEVRNSSDKEYIDLPFTVLVDSRTASSAEIFASAMRDIGGVKLIGEKTYGKSVIQRNFVLSDGSSVKFTVGEFIPASGESYNKKGLEPDIAITPEYPSGYGYYFLTEKNDNILKTAVDYIKAEIS